MKNSEKATIPAPKTNTQEQVDQTLKLASAGIKVTVERVEGKEGKLEKEEEKHDSPRSSRATPYVTPPSVSTDMIKVEMEKRWSYLLLKVMRLRNGEPWSKVMKPHMEGMTVTGSV